MGKHGEMCLGCGERCGKCVGVGKMRRSVGRDGGVGRCWERSRECKKVWEAVRCAVRGVLGKGRRVYHTSPHIPTHFPTLFQTSPTFQVNLNN